MNRKILRGTAAAFAAALAVTALAPATVSEAASSKAYVVSQKTDSDGTVHKYTYDKRGRVIKEVITATAGVKVTGKGGTGSKSGQTVYTDNTKVKSDGTVQTVIKNGSGETVVDTTLESYSTGLAVKAEVIDDVYTETITTTYYNSGAKKDQAKSKKSEWTLKDAQAIDYSLSDDNDGGFVRVKAGTKTWEYTYNSKGQCTKEVETDLEAKNWAVTLKTGKYAKDTAGYPDYTKSIAADYTQTITVKEKSYNSKGQESVWETSVGMYDYNKNFASDGYAADTETTTLTVLDGITTKFTYNKVGFPTKIVTVNQNKVAVSQNGGAAQTADLADTTTTTVNTYGDDLQLAKKEKTTDKVYGHGKTVTDMITTIGDAQAKIVGMTMIAAGVNKALGEDATVAQRVAAANSQEASVALSLTQADWTKYFNEENINDYSYGITNLVINKNNLETNPLKQITALTAAFSGTTYSSTDTTLYDNRLKDGTTLKVQEIAKNAGETEGAITNFKLKKISVPSSRLTGVLKEQALIQTDVQ